MARKFTSNVTKDKRKLRISNRICARWSNDPDVTDYANLGYPKGCFTSDIAGLTEKGRYLALNALIGGFLRWEGKALWVTRRWYADYSKYTN